MTTADPGSGRPGASWADPTSWVDSVGAVVRDDVDALLDRIAGPREVSARLVEAPAPDHDLDDVSLPASQAPAAGLDPGFGSGAEPADGSASTPTGRTAPPAGDAADDGHAEDRDRGTPPTDGTHESDDDGPHHGPDGSHQGDDDHDGRGGDDHDRGHVDHDDHDHGHDAGHGSDPGHDLVADPVG